MILVLNCGSSSVKYRLVPDGPSDPAGRGLIERVGEPGGPADHSTALEQVFTDPAFDEARVRAVGHRVVHGGARYRQPVLIDDSVLDGIRELVPLAPLHNPAGIAGIAAARARLPHAPQVACFDTAFHARLPAPAATYAIDVDIAQRYGIRRYGFHGISVAYVVERMADVLERPIEDLNLIVLHLGNGASATAVCGGRSVETSMGFTPTEGLVMGTRPGDLDAAVPDYLVARANMSTRDVDDLLQHHSGLTGLCGDNDMRAVLSRRADGDPAASLAFDVYCHRVRKYVGAYHAVLGRLDAIVFTAGVGEHAPAVRAACLAGLEGWGIAVDPQRNASGAPARAISPDPAPVVIWVVPTDEELAIANEVRRLLDGGPWAHGR
jgi:acetate kinase